MTLNLRKERQVKEQRELSDNEQFLLDFAKRLPFMIIGILVIAYLEKTNPTPTVSHGSCGCASGEHVK